MPHVTAGPVGNGDSGGSDKGGHKFHNDSPQVFHVSPGQGCGLIHTVDLGRTAYSWANAPSGSSIQTARWVASNSHVVDDVTVSTPAPPLPPTLVM